MKPIIANMNEISESKEVYESKPNIFFTLFIYLMLIIIAVALIWMYLGKIDIVVKSEAMIRPNDQVSTVINGYTGVIKEVNYEDGDFIQQGDILYIIEHEELLTEQTYLTNKINETKRQKKLLNKYKKSIEDDKNYFSKKSDQEEYYIRFENYYIGYNTMESDITYSEDERLQNMDYVTDQLTLLRQNRQNTEKLKNSIIQGKNLFTNSENEKEYNNLYQKYINDYEALNLQYDAKRTQVNTSIVLESTKSSLTYNKEKLKGLNTLKKSIESNKDYFKESNIYYMQYEEYISKREELETAYNQAQELYELNFELKDFGVTEAEVKQSKQNAENSEKAIQDYELITINNITNQLIELEKQISDLTLTKDNTLSKNNLIKDIEKEHKTALSNYKLQHITDLNTKLNSYKEQIKTLEENQKNLRLQGNKNYIYENTTGYKSQEGSLTSIKNTELQNTIQNIKTYENQINEMNTSLAKLEQSIDNAVVTASISGIINNRTELVRGDIIEAGREVLNIIPEDDTEYKVNIYVSNTDIGKIEEGMKIKCNVYALPSQEYGYITGTIWKISKDIKVDENNTSGYYLAQASIDVRNLYDYNGQEAQLKTGMGYQAQIITGSKKILTFMLEKLDLWK